MKFKYLLGVGILSLFAPTQLLAHSNFITPPSTEQLCAVDNPLHILVNKQNALPADYVPDALTVPDVAFSFSGFHEKRQLTADAAIALEKLFDGAQSESIELVAISGYRSYQRQSQIYANNVAKDGQAIADTYSARPGSSEHQTGLAMDISSASANYSLTEYFGDTPEGKWLASHAHEYGFIIRYPKGKEALTGYIYEPWHVRYVGVELATQLYINDLILEELDQCCSDNSFSLSNSLLLSASSNFPLPLTLFDLHRNTTMPYFLTYPMTQ